MLNKTSEHTHEEIHSACFLRRQYRDAFEIQSKYKETTVLVRNLQFPDGVTRGKDKSVFIFCEESLGRLRRYWLKGEKAGTSECGLYLGLSNLLLKFPIPAQYWRPTSWSARQVQP